MHSSSSHNIIVYVLVCLTSYNVEDGLIENIIQFCYPTSDYEFQEYIKIFRSLLNFFYTRIYLSTIQL